MLSLPQSGGHKFTSKSGKAYLGTPTSQFSQQFLPLYAQLQLFQACQIYPSCLHNTLIYYYHMDYVWVAIKQKLFTEEMYKIM